MLLLSVFAIVIAAYAHSDASKQVRTVLEHFKTTVRPRGSD
jgi:hypothetical protein